MSFAPIVRCDVGARNRTLDYLRLSQALATSLCWPAPALAHSALKTLGGFWAGVVHPLISVDQLGVLLALAIWIVWRSRRVGALVAALPTGAFLGAWGAATGSGAPLVAAAAMTFFGVMAAARVDLGSAWAERFAVALGGFIVGVASADGIEEFSRGIYAFGVALAAASIAAYAVLAARRAGSFPRWVEAGARGGAAVIAATGIGLLAANGFGWDAP